MLESKLLFKCLTIVFGIITLCGLSDSNDPSFRGVLEKLANDILGVSKFQEYLNKKVRRAEAAVISHSDLVKSIAEGIDLSLTKHIETLNRLNEAVTRDLENSTSGPNPSTCCNFNNVTADTRFRNELVNTASYCHMSSFWPASQQFSTNTFPVMHENLKTEPTLKWQYFGGADGSGFVYPGVDRCIDNADPRLKAWYYMTAGGTPKDILILIDTSVTMGYTYGSTGVSKLKVSIDAASNMVATLTPNDRVGIISFHESPEFPNAQSCYSNYLALANARNKEILSDYLDQLSTTNRNARYSPAIKEAFRLFNATQSSQGRVRVVLLLTDARSTSDRQEALCAISQGNSLLNNSVVFMTYGVDPSMTDDRKSFLKAIAQQTISTCPSVNQFNQNPVRAGVFTQVTEHDRNKVRSQILGFYYNMFCNVNNNVTTFSVPYNDMLGLGLVTSACQAVISNKTLLGVTCVDISIENIFKDIVNFKLGQLSYAYLIDNAGRTLLHPAVQRPENYESEPLFIDISNLEIHDQSDYVRNSMIRGENGSLSGNANLVAHRGSSQIQGVDGFNKNAAYYWYPITVMGASICLVIVEEERQKVKAWTGEYPPVYLTELFDIYNTSNDQLCGQWGKASALEASTVRLAPKAFVEPFNYSLVENNRNHQILLLQQYCEGKTNDTGDLNLRDGVRESIAMTYVLEEIWMQTTVKDYWDYTLFRYIGMEDGAARTYPGFPIAKGYDPTRRPWYTAAVGAGQLRDITVSTPYYDTSGVVLLTLCQSVFERCHRSSGASADSDPVFGVLGLDITLSSFYRFLISEFEPCHLDTNPRCFIVDSSGFIVIHRDYVTSAPASVEHITGKEPSIAYNLMDKSIMKRDTCTDFIDITQQLYWKIDIDQIKQLDTCTIYPVEGSNIFIIAPSDDTNSNNANLCQCSNTKSHSHCVPDIDCQCPCHSDISFDYCRWILPVSNTKPCLPPIAPINASDSKEVLTQGQKLPKCVICKTPGLYSNQSNCMAVPGCCWNSDKGRCESCQIINLTDNKIKIIVSVVVGSVVVVAACFLVYFLYICKNRQGRHWIPPFLSRRIEKPEEQRELQKEEHIENGPPEGVVNNSFSNSNSDCSLPCSSSCSIDILHDSVPDRTIRVIVGPSGYSSTNSAIIYSGNSRHICPLHYNQYLSDSDTSKCSVCSGVTNVRRRHTRNQHEYNPGQGQGQDQGLTNDENSQTSSEESNPYLVGSSVSQVQCLSRGPINVLSPIVGFRTLITEFAPTVSVGTNSETIEPQGDTQLKTVFDSPMTNTIPKTLAASRPTLEQSGAHFVIEISAGRSQVSPSLVIIERRVENAGNPESAISSARTSMSLRSTHSQTTGEDEGESHRSTVELHYQSRDSMCTHETCEIINESESQSSHDAGSLIQSTVTHQNECDPSPCEDDSNVELTVDSSVNNDIEGDRSSMDNEHSVSDFTESEGACDSIKSRNSVHV